MILNHDLETALAGFGWLTAGNWAYCFAKREGEAMENKEFNLLDEPWILALTREGQTKEVSLLELFKGLAAALCAGR